MKAANPRVVFAGTFLLILAIGFFLLMLTMAPSSTDPVELMRTVGTVSGVCGGIAIWLMAIGWLKKRPDPKAAR
jgi:hypothetical protein